MEILMQTILPRLAKWSGVLALLWPLAAFADPVTVVTLIGYAMTTAEATWAVVTGYALVIGTAVYGAHQAKKAAERDREAQRVAYNNGLRDRMATRVATDAPHRHVYGRARVGSDIVAMFTSGDRDQYKWLVCVHAAHECDAVEEIWVGNKALGTLTAPAADGSQDVTSGDYLLVTTESVADEAHTGASFTLAHTPKSIASLRVTWWSGVVDDSKLNSEPATLSGAVVTITSGISRNYICHYDYEITTPRVRVTKHLGGAADPADAGLMAALPTKWLSTAVVRGYCYTIVRLDLNQQEFQGGIPPIEVLLRGKKLYDPRSALTAWSANPALVLRDFLTGEMCGVAAADIPAADLITAANVCDEVITIDGASVAKYTFNGTISADQDADKVVEQIATAMAGGVVRTTWNCWAGKYVAPVMALDQSDIVGSLSVISGTPDADLYNGVRGQYIGPENSYVLTDFKPFQNAAYVTADGRELWTNIEFPCTDSAQRIHNLARIFCEDQRNGFTIKAVFSLKAWSLKVGQRVTFTSALLGQSAKVYRITDKRFGPEQAVELTLKEDAATIWDLADAVVVDSTPNSNLPNPFAVGLCGNVQMVEQLYETTGSVGVRSKATLTWTAPADVTVLDYEVEYKLYTSGVWIELFNVRGTIFEFYDLKPGMYDFRVKARNVLGAVGEYTEIKTFTVYGLTAAPANVSNFSIAVMAGMALSSWDATPDLDVRIGGKTVVRYCPLTVGASWEQSVLLKTFDGSAVTGIVPLATGTYYAKFIDSTGHYSDTAASFVATEALVTGWTTTATSTQHTAFAGTKTNTVALGGILKLDSATNIDAMTANIDTWEHIDNIGGVSLSGEYAFDATLDLTTKAARRFHAAVKSLAYDTGDTIDHRTNVDLWPSVVGAVINDCNIAVLASVSDDNITFGPWTPFMVADFNCRYAKFKAQLSSGLNTHNIQVSELSVTVKTPV